MDGSAFVDYYLTQARADRGHASANGNGDAADAPANDPANKTTDRTNGNDPPTDGANDDGGKASRPSQATELVRLATDRYDVALSDASEPFAVAHDGYGPYVARMLRGGRRSLRAELAAHYVAEHGRAPSSSALADTMLVLEGIAGQRPEVPLALRVARNPTTGGLVLDLGEPTGRAVVIEPEHWSVVERSPVLFRRTELTRPLPTPERGGRLEELRGLVNLTDDAWPLAMAWLVAALIPEIAHPIALFSGEHGSGKTTAARALTRLIDPANPQERPPPKDLESWGVAAAAGWIITLENISGIKPDLSDALCRAVTGDGLIRRTHYEMNNLTVLSFRRVVALTTIDPGALRGDLADRIITFDLERLADHRDETELEDAYQAAWPRLVGSLLDLAADVLAVLPTLPRVKPAPRMADFARVVGAVDALLGTSGLATYQELGRTIAVKVNDGDVLQHTLRAFIDTERTWQGPAEELMTKLTAALPDARKPQGWPQTPEAMAGALRRAAPVLRAQGYAVDKLDQRHGGQRGWQLSAPLTLLDDHPDQRPQE